jgi:hypothetical protein
MGDEFFCRLCKRELTGALDVTFSDVGEYTYLVQLETSDCNWRRCNGCKLVLCKKCDDEQLFSCCAEGRIVTTERALGILKEQRARDRDFAKSNSP